MSGHILPKASQLLALVALAIGGVACGPATVVDGVVEDTDFAIMDDRPAYHYDTSDDWVLLSMAEEDGETLRVVSLVVPDAKAIVLDEPMPIGTEESGLASVDVSIGDLLVRERSDGARILSTTDNRRTESVSGTVTFTSVDPYVGTFEAELEDGGHVGGSFVIETAG